MAIQFKSQLADFHNNLWRYHVPVPNELGNALIEVDNRRVVCTINNELSFQAALMHKEDSLFILLNDQRRKQLGLEEGDTLTVKLEKDASEYGLDMPDSFSAILDQDADGRSYFKALTMGKQRSLVYLVGKVKRVDSQIAKGLAIMHHLRESKGELDYKQLNEVIKAYNKRK